MLIWNKVFINGPSKICGREPLKNLRRYCVFQQTLQIFLKAVFNKFYLVHSWILCPIYPQRLWITSSFHPVNLKWQLSPRTFKSLPLLDSETNEESFLFKEEFEKFKVQAISEMENLILKEICFKRSYYHAFHHWCTFRKSSNREILSTKASLQEWGIKKQRKFDHFFVNSII